MSAGRRSDSVWDNFKRIPNSNKTGFRAICNYCKKELQGVLVRMRKHLSECQDENDIVELDEIESTPTTSTQNQSNGMVSTPAAHCSTFENNSPSTSQTSNIDSQATGPKRIKLSEKIDKFIIKTNKSQKEALDEQAARMIYATNMSFRKVHNKEFLKFCQDLRPGYVPPNEKMIANELLEKVYLKEINKKKDEFQNEVVCLAIDGWSNINNEAVLSSCVIKHNGDTALVKSTDTSGEKHDVPYVKSITQSGIEDAQTIFSCKVGSLVTDNHVCMAKMRDEIEASNKDIIAYGCSAHILNLLAHDFGKTNDQENTQKRVVHVVKYFRNHHLPKSWYTEAGGTALIKPIEVRWNSLFDTYKSFIKNWSILFEVCDKYRSEIDKDVRLYVQNIALKRNCEDLLALYEPLAVALKKMQSSTCHIADCVKIWKELEIDLLANLTLQQKRLFGNRYKMAIKPFHLTAYLLSPTINNNNPCLLTQEEISAGTSYIEEEFTIEFLAKFFKLRAKISPFTGAIMNSALLNELSDIQWWESFFVTNPNFISQRDVYKIRQLMTAVSSSSDIERVFSSFGQVHSKLRNRLGIEKASKLTFLYKTLN